MHSNSLFFAIFLVFTGAAALATIALYARQALLVAYIGLGILLGPSALGLIDDPAVVKHISNIGIIFLLFLLGMSLPPQKLIQLVRETTVVTSLSSLLFALLGIGAGWLLGLHLTEQLLVGAALMFSSTIIGLKLLPTTVLHHQRTGEIIISILLLQDMIAIVILLLIQGLGRGQVPLTELGMLVLSLPGLVLFAWVFDRFILFKLIRRFDKIQEYIFLMAIGWCLGMAELAAWLGLSHEIGAFIAGVMFATSPIALFISESLKPLRDFFLVLFFFSLGASFELDMVLEVLLPASLLAGGIMLLKPLVFRGLLGMSGESPQRSWEIGVRLGQVSEFSFLIAVLAMDLGVIGQKTAYLIEVATLLTFIASSYLVVLRYPTPIAVSDRLRRD